MAPPETATGASATPAAAPGAGREALGGVALALVLVAAAGFVDAVAFLGFGGVFTSFMSGDSTRLAAAWAGGEARTAVLYASAVALFVLGAAAGRVVRTGGASPLRRAAVLALTALLLLGAAAAGRFARPAAALTLSALAMGAQNAAIHRVGATPVTVTYVTGALARVGEGLGDLAMGRRPRGLLVHAGLWAGLVAGAVVGARSYARAGIEALAAPAILLGALAALLAATAPRRPSLRSA